MYVIVKAARTKPCHRVALVHAEPVRRLKGRHLAGVELGQVLVAHATLFGVHRDGEGVDDLDVELVVLGDVQDHCRAGRLGIRV